MSRRHWKHHEVEAGLTLHEVLVALSFFTLLGMGMLQLSSEAYYRDALHRETLAATSLANLRVEELLGAGYDDPRLADPDGGHDVETDTLRSPEHFQDPDHADPNNPLDSEGEAAGPRKFTRVWNVGADVPVPGIKTVTVIVGWRDQRGHSHVVSQTFQAARLD